MTAVCILSSYIKDSIHAFLFVTRSTAETTPVEEAEPIVEVITESVPIPAEAAVEIAAELSIEKGDEDVAAVASEVFVTEPMAEPALTEESAPPIVVEAAAEAAPVADPAETPEPPAAENTGTTAVNEVPPAPPAEAETVPAADVAAQSCDGSV